VNNNNNPDNKNCQINRRQFLQKTALVSGTVAGSSLLSGCKSNAENLPRARDLTAVSDYNPAVSSSWIKKGKIKSDPEEAYDLFKMTVLSANDFNWLNRGDSVLIKISINSGNPFPATSDPWSLKCMIRLLNEKGAGKILVGDQSGIADVQWTQEEKRGSSRALCDSAGLLRTINTGNASPCFFEEGGYAKGYKETLPAGRHHWKTPIRVAKILDEIDHLVYLPRVSSHFMSDITSGLKLAVGFLRTDSRMDFHGGGEYFYEMYEEVNFVPEIARKLRLIVSSGRSVLTLLGPNDGPVAQPDYGLIFASTDLLAHELLAYSWLKWNREHNTSFLSHMTIGQLTGTRSIFNRKFVESHTVDKKLSVPDFPFFEAGDIYDHPSIINFMRRKGGRPQSLAWKSLNQHPDHGVTDYIRYELLKSDMVPKIKNQV